MRKDVMENADVSWELKKKLAEQQKKKAALTVQEFACMEEGFSCASNIVIMEAKKMKRKKRR